MGTKTSMAVKTGAFSAAALLALTACGGDDGDDGGSDENALTISIADEPPYSYMSDDGEPTGAAVDLAERILGEEMGYELEYEQVAWDNLIPGLKAGHSDVVSAGMSILPERCSEAAFSEPEIMYTTALMVEEGNPHGLTDLDSVKDAIDDGEDIQLATLTGGIESGYAESLGLDSTGVGTAEEGMETVQGGRADVFAMTAISLNTIVEQADDPGVEVTDSFVQEIDGVKQFGAGSTVFRSDASDNFSDQDAELLEEYNSHQAELKESGELQEILEEHGFTEAEVPPEEMTAEQLCEDNLEPLQDLEL